MHLFVNITILKDSVRYAIQLDLSIPDFTFHNFSVTKISFGESCLLQKRLGCYLTLIREKLLSFSNSLDMWLRNFCVIFAKPHIKHIPFCQIVCYQQQLPSLPDQTLHNLSALVSPNLHIVSSSEA